MQCKRLQTIENIENRENKDSQLLLVVRETGNQLIYSVLYSIIHAPLFYYCKYKFTSNVVEEYIVDSSRCK